MTEMHQVSFVLLLRASCERKKSSHIVYLNNLFINIKIVWHVNEKAFCSGQLASGAVMSAN